MCSLKSCIKHCPFHTNSAHLEILLQKGGRASSLPRDQNKEVFVVMYRRHLQMTKADNYFPDSPGGHIPPGLNGKAKSAHLLMDRLCFYPVLCLHRLTVYFPKCLGDCNTEAGMCSYFNSA